MSDEIAIDKDVTSNENEMRIFREDLSLLVEAGFVAIKQLDETSATRLFLAAQAIAPDSTAPDLGLGYIALNKLELEEAGKKFQGVLDREPTNYLAQTFLGITFLLSEPKRKKGEQLIAEALAKTDDPSVKNLGEVSLKWVDKDLKKKESPFAAASASKPQS